MKYIIVIPDGMADRDIERLEGKTPLEHARTPMMDMLAACGEVGMLRTIPHGMSPGSDTANLSIMGYDPRKCHTGRSPLEAVSLGLSLDEDDMVFRCNLVTLSNDAVYKEKTMIDYGAGQITSKDSHILTDYIRTNLETDEIKLYSGVSYRHVMVWSGGPANTRLTPPHDILEKKIGPHLPVGEGSDTILDIMEESGRMLQVHPFNRSRMDTGLKPANSVWLWGQGKKPYLDDFYEKFGIRGSVISAVDLIRGIGIAAGMEVIKVKGITGTVDTNMEGKAKAAVGALLSGKDFVFVHVEAPDECSHQGVLEDKIKAIEHIDKRVIGYIKKAMDSSGQDYRLMVLPDHPTPLSIRTHSPDPVPFVIFDSRKKGKARSIGFNEKTASAASNMTEEGYMLAGHFFEKD